MIQIKEIVAYSHHGEIRSLPLKLGAVNIISGESKAGKSAVLKIIDYCFGASHCDVPEGKVRRNVSWFGLLLQTSSGQAFVARQVPLGEAKSSEVVYTSIGADIVIPNGEALRQTTNLEGLRSLLASWTGISSYRHTPPDGQTRNHLVASIRHAVALCLQSQNEIAQQKWLFHGANDRDKAQAIKDTLPYFLGAVSDEYLSQQSELKAVKAEIRQIERRNKEAANIRGEGTTRADTLLAEAKAVGLSSAFDLTSWAEKVATLNAIQSTPLSLSLADGNDAREFNRLTGVRNQLLKQQSNLLGTLDRARTFEGTTKNYSIEADEHIARLNVVSVFDASCPDHSCPLCLQELPMESVAPSVAQIKQSAVHLGQGRGAVDATTPKIEFAIAEVETELVSVRQQLGQNRELLSAVKKSNERLQLASDTDARRAMILGRISLYLENIPASVSTTGQDELLKNLKIREDELEKSLSNEAMQERLTTCLSNINRNVSKFAEQVKLEHSDSPLRLDTKYLTIVAETPERGVQMSQMGSGENHVGYHIVAHLALHDWFARRKRPVPSFLIFDQLSQAHFSPDSDAKAPKAKVDADRLAVKGLYGLIFDVTDALNGRLQVLITDHPYFDDDQRFKNAVIERWIDGKKLVPENWPTASN